MDHRTTKDRDDSLSTSITSLDDASARPPGKRSLTMNPSRRPASPPIQARQAAAPSPSSTRTGAPATAPSAAPGDDPFGLHLLGEQRTAAVHAAADAGIAGAGEPLPHRDAIQAAFGRHDVGGIAAHVGGPAASATEQMGAEAFATGHHVAFHQQPDLHTAAHEAAHVIQQRAGVQLLGGVGEVGDTYERGADEVADHVVRGESAEPLLDAMVGDAAAPSTTRQLQQRKGDFASLRKSGRPPTFLVRIKGDVRTARIISSTEATVTLQIAESDEIELPRDVVEGDGFELMDKAVPLDVEAEKRVMTNKKRGLVDVFLELVDGKAKVTEEHVQIAKAAHDPSQGPLKFATSQQAYQRMLLATFGLSRAEIMNVHRSAGYEYEFGRFLDPLRPEVSTEPELLRSHVTLALSPVFGELFEGRAAHFRLETDSRNCLELVTPPFLSLICGETGDLLGAIHTLFSTTTLKLGHAMQSATPAEEGEKESKEKEKEKEEEKQFGVPIRKQLGLFASTLCGGDWAWVGEEETSRFCFSYEHAKHGTRAYGQVNISMTPEEIVATAEMLPQWNLEESKSGLTSSSFLLKSVPTALSDSICDVMMKKATSLDDRRLKGAITLHARSTSNLVGIPSILYRRTSGERPEEGNLATEIKETLLLWVKDFPHTVIADCLAGTESAVGFIEILTATAGEVWSLIADQLIGNVKALELEATTKVTRYATNDFIIPFIQRQAEKLPLEERKKIMLALKQKSHPMQTCLLEGVAAAKLAIDLAKAEYENMIELQASSVGGAPYGKRHTKDENAEEFGEGYGVRKDTYLDRTPGARRLRVAEIRDTSHLERLKQIL